MHGCGNDYVYIDCTVEQVDNPAELAKAVSDRRKGIGSDGLILIASSETADFRMWIYNADGSMGLMCGNGIRCVGKYVYEHGLTDKTQLCIETSSGLRYLRLLLENGRVDKICVNMGAPILTPQLIPVSIPGYMDETVVDYPLTIADREFHITCLSVGNPHAVTFLEEVADFEILAYGPLFEHHPIFPEQVNTEFIKVIGRNELVMRVYERGSGETFACGTGATAAAYAAMLNGYTDNEVTVHLLGGDLHIRYDKPTNSLFMTGEAVEVYSGEWGVISGQ
jgi:diaminopimelate epimerase